MSQGFGGVGNDPTPQSRTLSSITDTPNPGVQDYSDAQKFAEIVQRHDFQIKALAQGQQQLQTGVNEATANPIQQIQQFVADIVVLLGGGELTAGALDFGDLQYILPVIGALFGLGDAPFPIDLFQAAEKFFFGYVVPNEAFTDEINTIIQNWLSLIGIDPKFIKDLKALVTAVGELFGEVGNLFPSISSMLSELGLTGNDLGPLGQLLAPIIHFFSGIDLKSIGGLLEFVTDAIDPFVVILTKVINFVNGVLAVFGFEAGGGGGVVNSPLPALTQPFENLMSFLGNIDLGLSDFHPLEAAETFIEAILKRAGILGSIPAGALTNDQPNLLPQPTFAANSISSGANAEWVIDTTTSRTADGSGSASLVADGHYHALRSGQNYADRMTVGPGQTLTASIYVSHQGYSGVGDPPIQLQLVPFISGAALAPVTLATYAPPTADVPWPGQQLTGDYTVPDAVTAVQMRILVTDGALAGTLRFDDASVQQMAAIPPSMISGLPAALQNAIDRIQTLIDTIVNAITGNGSILNSLEDLADSLLVIPFENIIGVGGPANIGATVLELLNNLVGGLIGIPAAVGSFADLFNIGQQVSSNASQGANSWQVLGIRDNTSQSTGFLPSGRANFNLTDVAFNSSAPTIAVTQAASAICTDRVIVSQPLGVISWLGFGVTNITAFYINVWKFNPDTNICDLEHHSPNIIGNLAGATGTTPVYLFYEPLTPIAQTATEQFAYEYVPVGTGTHHMVGQTTGSWLPAHPTAPVSNYGYTRDNTTAPDAPPSSIAKADLVGADTVPWTEVAINNAGASGDSYADLVVYFTESGSVPIPNWANYIDVIPLGAGGGGAEGGTLGFYGHGGAAGTFGATTWLRDTDFDDTVTTVDFVDGPGGVGGSLLGGPSTNGGDTTFSVPGRVATGPGGARGVGLLFGGHTLGAGPGPFTYKGLPCGGGGGQSAYGGAGASPGGGGAGGNWVDFQHGGAGAPGAGWVRFRQSPIPGESGAGDTSDTTPSTNPNVAQTGATYSTVTVTASYMTTQTVTAAGIPSGEAFGHINIPFVIPRTPGAPQGDADGVTELPHKVPYTK